MRLPVNRDERDKVYRNLIRYCEVSRSDRRARSRRLRQFYLTGSDSDTRVRYNKIMEHVMFSSSFLYAPDSVKFGVTMPAHYGDRWTEEAQAARSVLAQYWEDSDASLVFDMGVTWAHVWDSVVFKVKMDDNHPQLTMVPDPSDIGVLHEDLNDWDRQEAICHWYQMDVASFTRYIAKHPNAKELIRMAETYAVPGYEASSEMLPPTVNRIILASASPNMIGAVNATPDLAMAIPVVKDPVVRLAELWVYDDDLKDYRVVTNFLATEEILWQPPNPLNPGEHPFHDLCLQETPGYIWGLAPIEALLALQNWREQKMESLDLRDNLQLDPPMLFEGITNALDGEKAKTFRRPGGSIQSSAPNARVTPFAPAPLPEPFGFIEQIDYMFSRMGGLPKGMTGETGAGVRSGEQAEQQAAMGGGPTRKRAMRVESSLAAIATALLRLERRVKDRTLTTHDGRQFLFSQMPGDFMAKVWGHSASPVYAERTVQKAIAAKQLGAIDGETLLDYLDLPLTEELKAKARALAKAQAEKSDRVIEIKEKEAQAKLNKANRAS